jgi:hypothetical protein
MIGNDDEPVDIQTLLHAIEVALRHAEVKRAAGNKRGRKAAPIPNFSAGLKGLMALETETFIQAMRGIIRLEAPEKIDFAASHAEWAEWIGKMQRQLAAFNARQDYLDALGIKPRGLAALAKLQRAIDSAWQANEALRLLVGDHQKRVPSFTPAALNTEAETEEGDFIIRVNSTRAIAQRNDWICALAVIWGRAGGKASAEPGSGFLKFMAKLFELLPNDIYKKPLSSTMLRHALALRKKPGA